MKPLIVALVGATTVTDPTARQLAAWALAAHQRDCGSCRPGQPCTDGRRYAEAANADNGLPGYPPV